MDESLPISVFEPASKKKAALLAQNQILERKRQPYSQEVQYLPDIKNRLKEVREYTCQNLTILGEHLRSNLARLYPGVKLIACANSDEAVSYIKTVSSGMEAISVNNASTVRRELMPGLIRDKLTVINSYLSEYAVHEKTIRDYWDIPFLLENARTARGSFDIALSMNGLDRQSSQGQSVKKYLAVLGVNAVGAEDGSVVFLQHFHNITKDLACAQKVIIVIGMDKMVRSGEDARFVAECMGIFGMESVLLGIKPTEGPVASLAEMELPPSDGDRELHILLLDNGRCRQQSPLDTQELCSGFLGWSHNLP
jgi:L-lactate utilization protein LutB